MILKKPLITVAMPVFNAGNHLRVAVNSIINQTYKNWELIIIDDGSTDDSIKSLDNIEDHRISIIRDGKNKGLAARLNQIIDMAKGHFIARMDQDDISYPNRFSIQINYFERFNSLDLIGSKAICISEKNKPVGYLPFKASHKELTATPWRGFYLPHSTWIGKVEWFRRHRYANPAPYLCEDQELLLRTHSDSKFSAINSVLLAYRVKDKVLRSKLLKTRWSVFKAYSSYFLKNKQLFFLVLTLIALIGRIFQDLLKFNFTNTIVKVEDKNILKDICRLNDV